MECPTAMTLDLFLRIVSAASTLVIGIAASWLAYRQFKISNAKLRFELYEKRLVLFRIVRDFASAISMEHKRDSFQTLDDAGKFYRDTIEHHFLFDADVSAYFDEMYQKAKDLSHVELELSRPNLTSDERTALNKQTVALMAWFFEQSGVMLTVFRKDLSIRTLQ